MKTNVILSSASRELFGVTIRQETKTQFMNLSDLQLAYNNVQISKGWSHRTFDDVLASKQNHERIFYLLATNDLKDNHEFITPGILGFMEMVKNNGIAKVLKQLGVYQMKGKGSSRSVFCNPYIWVLVAMEMNPEIYAIAVTWLTDKLILNRVDSGDVYKDLSKAASKFIDVDYKILAKAMNHIIFGRHETDIRNTGTVDQLKELHKLESNLCFLIDTGLINSFSELRDQLVRIWQNKQLTP